MSAIDGDLLRRTLKARAALLWQEIDGLSRAWISPALDRVASVRQPKLFPKTINDPVWGSVDIYPWEALLLDSPLIQRLRGIKQLAMAHHVYPGATHTRHSHSLGVVQAAEEMMRAVERNARHRRAFGMDRDEQIPEITDSDRYLIRLAGLLHDIGHGPYSHATEPLARSRHSAAFDALDEVLRETFPETTTIQTSEAIAVLLILSDAMREFLADRRTLLPVAHPDPAVSIVARLLGSSAEVSAGYLSNIISGPLDADKLDYMARDSHHSGLPLGLDLDRLISKLEVIVVTEQNAPTDELADEVRRSPRRRLYLLGISLSGLAAYEQMIIARVFLYDRLYYHHKIRAAEAMLRRLYMSTAGADQQVGTLANLMAETDESLIASLRIINQNGQPPSRTLKTSFESREIYRRSLAFAERFVTGVSGLAPVEQEETRTMIWNSALASLSSEAETEATAMQIYELASELLSHTPGSPVIRPEHVIIDVPPDAVVPRSSRILARAEGGELQTPNLYFNPERWSGAYRKQKHLGYVYAHESVAEVVAFSARAILFERFKLLLSEQALRLAKVQDTEWSRFAGIAREHGLVSTEFLAALESPRTVYLKPFMESELRDVFPEDWLRNVPNLPGDFADALTQRLPFGVVASVHRDFLEALSGLCRYVVATEQTGTFVGFENLSERDFQVDLRKFLYAAGLSPVEGSEVAGGESDLIVNGFVVENKVRGETADPHEAGPHYQWQERRYSIAINSSIGFVCVAYRPVGEAAILPQWRRLRVIPDSTPEARAQIRVVVPFGHSRPSAAKAPC